MPEHRVPNRIRNLALPERQSSLGKSVRDAERELAAIPYSGALLDLTYADTKRFPPPAWVLRDFINAAQGGGMTYTPYRGDAAVRSAVAESLSSFLGVSVNPDQELILTPGSQAALFGILASVVEEGDSVALVDPDYLSSERILRFFGASVNHIPLLWDDPALSPTPDLDALEQALRGGASVFLLSNPNNPTGMVYPPEVVDGIVALALRYNTLVIVDELYARLIYDDITFSHLISRNGMRDNCVTLLGPSKTESMSGYRVGLAVGPPELINRMEDFLGLSVLRAPAYAQHTMVRWLSDDHEFVDLRVAEYQELRELTVRSLNATDFIRVRPAMGTAYMFPDVTELGCSDQIVAGVLKREAGLAISPGYQFGPRGSGHFRICFAQEENQWRAALDRMVASLERLRS